MSDPQPLVSELSKLSAVERRIVERFIQRKRVISAVQQGEPTFGERVADGVAAFGGSWSFIGLALATILGWIVLNVVQHESFDPYPFILLNLVLSCMAGLQAPIIMMSQNRHAARDREEARHDYEVNTKAELEIVALHAKLDEIRDQKWVELVALQNRQIELLESLLKNKPA
ncbi:MAG: DUF1003 domain-containing protein [Acidobacteria bacterium]|nr:DUF1003 domain-containing protein [Acidobacteriota bacterium]